MEPTVKDADEESTRRRRAPRRVRRRDAKEFRREVHARYDDRTHEATERVRSHARTIRQGDFPQGRTRQRQNRRRGHAPRRRAAPIVSSSTTFRRHRAPRVYHEGRRAFEETLASSRVAHDFSRRRLWIHGYQSHYRSKGCCVEDSTPLVHETGYGGSRGDVRRRRCGRITTDEIDARGGTTTRRFTLRRRHAARARITCLGPRRRQCVPRARKIHRRRRARDNPHRRATDRLTQMVREPKRASLRTAAVASSASRGDARRRRRATTARPLSQDARRRH